MIKLFSLLKRGRFRKKRTLYKQVWQMTFDPIILIYIAVFLSYVGWAIYQSGNISLKINQFAFQMEAISITVFWMVMTAIPLGLLVRTFTRPGIIISTAEYRASILPFTKRQIWWMAAGFRWMKLAVILTVIGLVIYLASPTSGGLVLLYVGLLLMINILMTSVEWRVFQLHMMWKIIIFIVAISVNILSFLTNSAIVGLLTLFGLLILNIAFLSRITSNIRWEKVTAACDYQVWNMPLMTYFTKQKMKKERAYTIWQRMPFWRKAFPYRKEAVYGRLWFIYWQRQIVLVLQFLGTIVMLVSFIPLLNMWLIDIVALFGIRVLPVKDWFFFVALAVGMHMYVTITTTFWRDRLTTDIVHVLPWDLVSLHKTLLKWAYPGVLIFILPMYLFSLEHFSWLFVLQMVLALSSVSFLLYWKNVEAFQMVSEKETFVVPKTFPALGYSMYVTMIISAFIPSIITIGLILVGVASVLHVKMYKFIH